MTERSDSPTAAAVNAAVDWLTGPATIKDNRPVGPHGGKMPVDFWNGAIRGEYLVAARQWDSFCPVWHTGQAVKALVLAAGALDRPEWLEAARFSAEFILQNRVTAGADSGLILAYEDHPDKVNTSAVLESLDGLFHLSAATGDPRYREAAVAALRWCMSKAWDADAQVFNDVYDVAGKRFLFGVHASQGRPLLDDAVFLQGWRLTGDEAFKNVAVRTAETLLRDESPPGNWVNYIPCNRANGNIHPRHAYWWGMPMSDVYDATGDERFLACFSRAVDWYRQALRRDGGIIRNTYTDFNTDSFGHATSGAACAVIVFLKHFARTGDRGILEYARRGLDYCMRMQFTKPDDPNLKGCILEKILPPDGTDRSPYHVRDLGTIFFIQAAARMLRLENKGAAGEIATAS